jgi:hypothetical protein
MAGTPERSRTGQLALAVGGGSRGSFAELDLYLLIGEGKQGQCALLDRHFILPFALGAGLGLTPKAVQSFRREAKAAAKFHHTNIVPTLLH